MPYYRLRAPFTSGHDELAKGTLLFTWRASKGPTKPDHVRLSASTNGWGTPLEVPLDQLDGPNPQPKAAEFEQLLRFYMEGNDPLPNAEAMPAETLDDQLNMIAYAGQMPSIGRRALLPGHDAEWATAFLGTLQMAPLDGRALVMFYKPSWSFSKNPPPRFAKFALCDHDVVKGANANPSRGWHPARCSKCDLNLSVDSSD